MPGNNPRWSLLFTAALAVIFVGHSNLPAQEIVRPNANSRSWDVSSVPSRKTATGVTVHGHGLIALVQNVEQDKPAKGLSPRLWGKIIKVGFICLFLVGAGAVWLFNKLKVQ